MPEGGPEARYHRGMDVKILVGTEGGLWRRSEGGLEPLEPFTGKDVTALARDGARTWALVEGRTLWARDDGGPWREQASVEGPGATCLAATADGLLVGAEQARLLRLVDGRLSPIE